VEPGIIHFREITSGTPETLRIMGARIEELATDFDAYGIIIDLTEVDGGTTGDYRRFIPEYFNEHSVRSKNRLKIVAVVFDANPVLRVAVRFLVARASNVPSACSERWPSPATAPAPPSAERVARARPIAYHRGMRIAPLVL